MHLSVAVNPVPDRFNRRSEISDNFGWLFRLGFHGLDSSRKHAKEILGINDHDTVPFCVYFLKSSVLGSMKKVHAIYVRRGIVEAVVRVFFSTEGYEKIFAFVAIRTEEKGIGVLQIPLPCTGNLYPLLMLGMGTSQMADGLD